jgi:hypothetical protein
MPHRAHRDWLYKVATGPDAVIAPEMAHRAWRAWCQAWSASGFRLPVPDACPGPDGELIYVWDRGRYHLELELIPDGPDEFFYRDRERIAGADRDPDGPLPAAALDLIARFLEGPDG